MLGGREYRSVRATLLIIIRPGASRSRHRRNAEQVGDPSARRASPSLVAVAPSCCLLDPNVTRYRAAPSPPQASVTLLIFEASLATTSTGAAGAVNQSRRRQDDQRSNQRDRDHALRAQHVGHVAALAPCPDRVGAEVGARPAHRSDTTRHHRCSARPRPRRRGSTCPLPPYGSDASAIALTCSARRPLHGGLESNIRLINQAGSARAEGSGYRWYAYSRNSQSVTNWPKRSISLRL